jgi:hypothetical protein
MKRNRKNKLNSVFQRVIDEMIATGNYTFNKCGIPMTQTTARELRARIAEDMGMIDNQGWLIGQAEICRFYDTSLSHDQLAEMRANGAELPPIMYMIMPTTLTAHRIMRPYTDRAMYSSYVRTHLQNCVRDRRCIQSDCNRQRNAESFVARVKKMDLTPKVFRYNRAISVEIEGFAPVGFETMSQALPIWARTGGDGSIRVPSGRNLQAHEVKALFPRELMEPRLYKLCSILNTIDFRVNRSCGLHVHVDRRGMSESEVVKLARRVDKWIEQLIELFPLSRRDNSYCKGGIAVGDRYRRVNVSAFHKYQTLEFRVHSGTCNYTKILMWIRLIELLMAMPKPPKPADTLGTLSQLPLPENDRSYWLRRHREINPHLYNEPAAQNNDSLNTEE